MSSSRLFWCVLAIVLGCFGAVIPFCTPSFFVWATWAPFVGLGMICVGRRRVAWACLVVAFALYAFCRFQADTVPSPPEGEKTWNVVVTRVFRTRGKSASCIGTIMGGREEELVGQKILFSAYHKKVPARGQKCRVSGELKVLHDPFPMERFDFFLWVNGVRYKMPYVRSCRLNRRCPETLFGALNRRCENILSAHVEDGVPAKAYKAMILGRKEHLEPSVYHYFLLTGTLHLFAVSGLHVGVIAAVAFCLFRLLPLPMSIRYVLALALVAGYVFVVGASPSTLRAFVMVCTLMVARLLYRRAHVEGALLTSLFFVLLTRPKQLLDVGFQLSYGIVGALVWLGTPLDIYLQRICTTPYVPKPPFSRARWTFEAVKIWLIHSFAISSAATVFSQILMAYYWRYTTPLALLLNVCVVPLASFAVACGGCALLFGMIAPVLSLHGCFNVVAVTTVRILVRILSWASSWPLAKVDVSFSLPVTVLCAGLFFAAALFFDHFVHRNDCAQTRLGWT